MNDFKWRHFEGAVILWAVRWYCKYGVSYRNLEEMLDERGVKVDHSTIYRWVQRYAPEMERRLRWYWKRHNRSSRQISRAWRRASDVVAHPVHGCERIAYRTH